MLDVSLRLVFQNVSKDIFLIVSLYASLVIEVKTKKNIQENWSKVVQRW